MHLPFDPHQPVIRWVTWRKQKLLEALDRGEITVEDIWLIHEIGPEELKEWRRRNGTGGDIGLLRLRMTDRTALTDRTDQPRQPNDRRRGRPAKRKPRVKPVSPEVPDFHGHSID